MPVDADALARLKHAVKTGRMWGSPEELEAVGQHLAHVFFLARAAAHPFAETAAWWRALGGPFAADAQEHAALRAALYGDQAPAARTQVVLGFAAVWAELDRDAAREAVVAPHLEGLLDQPERAGPPDVLNAVLFALMGLVAADARAYVEALGRVRAQVGGHPLRALQVVAPPGPSAAQLASARRFASWDAVLGGLARAVADLEGRPPVSPEAR